MTVRRIVANLAMDDPAAAGAFYEGLLGLRPVMDLGWIVTFAGEGAAAPQISVAREGGDGAPVPDLSVEVDDADAVHARARSLGLVIERPIRDETWGVRRFFLRDPAGRLLNVLSHLPPGRRGE